MTLNPQQRQFFSLLRAGLWGKEADASLFDASTDWMALFQLAKSQASLGVVYDGVLTLPRELRPERRLFLQWSNIVAQIEEENDHLNDRLLQLFALYREHGLAPVLLKGQGVAQNYLHPEHRQCGDIDVYIGFGDFEKANDLLRPEATEEDDENHRHTSITWRGVVIENHRIMAILSSPVRNRFFQRLVSDWYPNGRPVTIKGDEIAVPPLEFDLLFVFIHSIHHFFNEGVGLRQVCDWANLLYAHREQLDRKELMRLLKGVGLTKAARAFGAVAVDFVGLPESCLPFTLSAKDHSNGEWLLREILAGGNFGHYYQSRERRPSGYWAGKWYTFRRAYKRCLELGSLAPSEAYWYPVSLAVASLKTQLRLRLHINLS